MDNQESPPHDPAGIDRILESIRIELKNGLDGIRQELKADLKTELNSMREELRSEADSIKNEASQFAAPPPLQAPPPLPARPPFPAPPPPPQPFADFTSREAAGKESGRKTQEFPLSDFSGIEVGGAFEVEIVRSDTFAVSITAEDRLFGNLSATREGETLRIRHARHISWRAQLTRPRARISLPVLKELRLSGATRATVSGFNSSEAFKLDLSGASSVDGQIAAGDADLELSGASHARLAGSARNAVIAASGANDLDLRDFSVRDAAVKLSGASHATLRMDGRLDARLNGVSHLSLIGDPVMGNIRTSGASRLSKE